jgi:hypothetical protein
MEAYPFTWSEIPRKGMGECALSLILLRPYDQRYKWLFGAGNGHLHDIKRATRGACKLYQKVPRTPYAMHQGRLSKNSLSIGVDICRIVLSPNYNSCIEFE